MTTPSRRLPACARGDRRQSRAGAGAADRTHAAGVLPGLRERSGGNRIDWSHVRTFNLDEFVGVGGDHPGSYRAFMQTELFEHVSIDPANIDMLNGGPPISRPSAGATKSPSPTPAASICRLWASVQTVTSASTSLQAACARTRTSPGSNSRAAKPMRSYSAATGPASPNARCRWAWAPSSALKHRHDRHRRGEKPTRCLGWWKD